MREKKIIVPIHSNPTRNRKFQNNSKEMQKINKHHYGLISRQNGLGQAECDTKRKVIVLIHSKPTQNREFQKNKNKNSKT